MNITVILRVLDIVLDYQFISILPSKLMLSAEKFSKIRKKSAVDKYIESATI